MFDSFWWPLKPTAAFVIASGKPKPFGVLSVVASSQSQFCLTTLLHPLPGILPNLMAQRR